MESRMYRVRNVYFFAVLAITVFSSLSNIAAAETKIGVLAPRGELKAVKRWSALGKFIGEKIGDSVVIKPYSASKLVKAAAAKDVDFMLSNPTQAVILQEVYPQMQ